jgi:hypothetical protein
VNEAWTEAAVVSPKSKLPTIAALAAPWKSMAAQDADHISLKLFRSLMGLIVKKSNSARGYRSHDGTANQFHAVAPKTHPVFAGG